MGQSKTNREYVQVIERYTSNYSMAVAKSGHMKITIRRGPEKRTLTTSVSPSSRDTLRMFENQVRRAWEGLRGRGVGAAQGR